MTLKVPPGPRGLKILGELGKNSVVRLATMRQIAQDYGDIAYMRFLNNHYYLLNHPDLVRQVLVERAEHFYSLPISLQRRVNLPTPGELAMQQVAHRAQRKLIAPAFTATSVERYAQVMLDYTHDQIAAWHTGQPFDLGEAMMALTLRIVARVLFDADSTNHTDTIGQAVNLGMNYLSRQNRIPLWLPTRQNLKMIKAWIDFDGEVKRIVATRRSNPRVNDDLLERLIAIRDDDGKYLDDQQVHSLVMALLIAGHETTASALQWIWWLTAQHTEVLEKLRAEVSNMLVTADRVPDLPYTEAVIKECIRLYPPAWLIYRYAVSMVDIGDYTVPRGAIIFLSPYLMHRHHRYYTQVETFMPERWLSPDVETLPPYAFYPFGGGAHTCTGQFFALLELKLVLATLVQHGTPLLQPNQVIQPQPMITMRPDRSIMARYEPISE